MTGKETEFTASEGGFLWWKNGHGVRRVISGEKLSYNGDTDEKVSFKVLEKIVSICGEFLKLKSPASSCRFVHFYLYNSNTFLFLK